jgi:curved DNA-binding protein CbpA
MVAERTLYSVLGVDPDAPNEVVKAAYRALAKQYHPDGNGSGSQDSTAKFIELQEAYSVISDEEKRAEYDRTLSARTKDDASLGDDVDAEISTDEIWVATAKEHPEIDGIHQILSQYSSALANRFVLAVANCDHGSDPAGYAFELEKAYFKKYFGDTPELQGLARRLLQAGLRQEAIALNRAINEARNDNPNLEAWKVRRILGDFESLLDEPLGQRKEDNGSASSDATRTQPVNEDDLPVDDQQLAENSSRDSKPSQDGPKGARPHRGLAAFFAGGLCLLLTVVALAYSTISKVPDNYKDEATFQTDPASGDSQASGNLELLDPLDLCRGALVPSRDRWDYKSLMAVEAENRGMSVDDCRIVLGLETTPDPTNTRQKNEASKKITDRLEETAEQTQDTSETVQVTSPRKKQIYDRIVGEVEVAPDAVELQTVQIDKTSKSAPGNSSEVVKVEQASVDTSGTNQSTSETATPSILESLSSKLLCISALNSGYESATVAFSSYPTNQEKVREAQRRGLTVSDCIAIIQSGSTSVVEQAPTKPETNSALPKPKRQVALVIGNSKYRTLPWLDNPNRDAKAMADSLATAGFDVTLVLDGTQNDLRLALFEFSRNLGDNTDVALLYYSGHAVQVSESNLLLPIDLDEEDRDEIGISSLSLSEVVQVMNAQRVPNKILILDACRNNPLNDVGGQGLATVKAGMGTFIAYSTQPGNVAEDGRKGSNSPYTDALVAALRSPSGSIEDTFKKVRTAVAQATEGRQVPWESSSLVDEFAFEVRKGAAQGSVKTFNSSTTGATESDDGELVVDATDVDQGYPAPKPRPKPIEVLMMAAVNLEIEPASAPPPDPTKRVSPVAGNSQGYVIAPESMIEGASLESNAATKTSLTEEVDNGAAEDVPTIRNITASASGDDLFWSPTQLVFDTNKAVRRDGAPQQFTSSGNKVEDMLPGVSDAQAEEPPQQGQGLAVAQMDQAPASGKGDMLVVNRKGSLLNPPTQKPGQVDVAE